MDKLLHRKKSHRKTTVLHGITSSNTAAAPDTPNPRSSIQTLYVSYLSELSFSEMCALARILHVKNFNGSNMREMERLMTALPPHLSSGRGIIDKLPKSITDFPDPALLCATHKPLNGRVIRDIMNLIKAEVGWKLSTLIAYGEMTNRQRQIVNTVRDIYSLWMKPAQFSKNIKGTASGKWEYELSGCEACILAKIGAEDETLTALRTALLSRTQTKDPRVRPPTLLNWVEAWIDTGVTAGATKAEIRYRSVEECKALKEARKLAHARRRSAEERKAGKGRRKLSHPRQKLRRDERRHRVPSHRESDGVTNTDPVADPPASRPRERTDSDPENAIIDEYGNFLSPEYLPSASCTQVNLTRKPEEEGRVHPAFRESDSVEVADEKGRFASQNEPVDAEALRKKLREETASVWNTIGTGISKGAEQEAEEYRNLLRKRNDQDDEEGDWDDASVYSMGGEETLMNSRDGNRVTRWDDLYDKK